MTPDPSVPVTPWQGILLLFGSTTGAIMVRLLGLPRAVDKLESRVDKLTEEVVKLGRQLSAATGKTNGGN